MFWVFFCRMSSLRCMSYSPLLSFGPSVLVPGSAYLFLHLSVFGVPQYPCRRQALSGRRRRALALASVRRSNCTYSFPVCSFHEDSITRAAREGINPTKFTSACSPTTVRAGYDRQETGSRTGHERAAFSADATPHPLVSGFDRPRPQQTVPLLPIYR